MTHRQVFPITMTSVDAVGIVFFGAYWDWFESTFEGFVAAASGISWQQMLASGLAMPVVHAEIDYMHPLRLSEQVTVEMRLTKVGSSSAHFQADFRNGGEDLVAQASTVNVVVRGEDVNEIEMPRWLIEAIERDPVR